MLSNEVDITTEERTLSPPILDGRYDRGSETKSTIKSVTIGDVLEATREDKADVDVSTCRAYSRGVCLMR